jgi:hypothetical protein
MTAAPMPAPRRRRALAACVAGSVAAIFVALPSVASDDAAQAATTLDRSHAGFCAEVQRRLVSAQSPIPHLPVTNVVETGFEAFKRSKPAVRPLRTHQYLAADAAGRPMELSCKTKTADHLRSAQAAAAAATPRRPVARADGASASPAPTCRHLHRDMAREIWHGLTPAQRGRAAFPPSRVMLEPDAISHTGSGWVSSHAAAWRSAEGRLHLRSAALFAEWEDWRWKLMPESWRGNHYCHLVAPERLRRLMLGDELPPAADPG